MKRNMVIVATLLLMIFSVGSAFAEAEYIGIDKAQDIAIEQAGLTRDQLVGPISVELDREDGVYEIKFQAENVVYKYYEIGTDAEIEKHADKITHEYKLDAVSGEDIGHNVIIENT